MPLGQRVGDKSDSRYCGVEVLDFPAGEGLPAVLNHSLASAFDFILAPLVGPVLLRYRPPPPSPPCSIWRALLHAAGRPRLPTHARGRAACVGVGPRPRPGAVEQPRRREDQRVDRFGRGGRAAPAGLRAHAEAGDRVGVSPLAAGPVVSLHRSWFIPLQSLTPATDPNEIENLIGWYIAFRNVQVKTTVKNKTLPSNWLLVWSRLISLSYFLTIFKFQEIQYPKVTQTACMVEHSHCQFAITCSQLQRPDSNLWVAPGISNPDCHSTRIFLFCFFCGESTQVILQAVETWTFLLTVQKLRFFMVVDYFVSLMTLMHHCLFLKKFWILAYFMAGVRSSCPQEIFLC